HGNAIPFTNTINSMRKIDGNKNFSVDRSKYVQIQTPQIFKTKLIKESLDSIQESNYTDEASLIEEIGLDINLVEGEEENIKITTKKDLTYFN
ncbi:MAG: 2-C-methyl-D-erythritol 4-phosphate cytidylyltransferase, partial [Bacteroidota bacterium]|nr:2-C-methyl-D-erythritol 4-phosphate cytidylyltransferase [Bacteroidota bacterium]